MAHIVLINPRFEVSYWGLQHALPLFGKRGNLPPACLPLLAALTPSPHRVTLIDENVEDIDYDRVAQADVVGVTGMSVQRLRMREILQQLKRRGASTVVGGPWVTVREDYFDKLADVIFVGEAEETWPRFLQDWEAGHHQARYEQAERTDMTTVPTPRFELLKMQEYMFSSLQFSRGCPFECEFCDIIVTFGRRPRLKTSVQMIAELEALRAERMEMVFVVDDNFIGNKKAIKLLLRDLVRWQQANGYPLMFFTEATINLADDDELLRLMAEANFTCVFVGIESTSEDSLRETKKFQNLDRGSTMLQKIHKLQEAGLDVWGGMILGFDNDDGATFAAQREFLQEARIIHAMPGMLYAIPKTPLHARLEAEGRLDPDDQSEFGTNVIPLRMSRAELRDGYVGLFRELYAPEAYFERLDSLFLSETFRFSEAQGRYWRSHPWAGLKAQLLNVLRFAFVYRRLTHVVPDEALRDEYRRRIARLLRRHRNPAVLLAYALKCVMHFHHYTMAEQMARHETPIRNTF